MSFRFLLAQLHISRLVASQTRKDVEDILGKIASGEGGTDLETAYEKTIIQIEEQGESAKSLAKRTLAWLVLTRLQLSIHELCSVLSVEAGAKEFNEKAVPAVSTVKKACASLVAVNQSSGRFRLVHDTTREFFSNPELHFLNDMHAYLAEICFTYLLGQCPDSGTLQIPQDDEQKIYIYAAGHWNHHLRRSPRKQLTEGSMLQSLRNDFLQIEPMTPAFQSWLSSFTLSLILKTAWRSKFDFEAILSPPEWGCQAFVYSCRDDYRRHVDEFSGVWALLAAIIPKWLANARLVLASCPHPEHWKNLDETMHYDYETQCQSQNFTIAAVEDLRSIKNVLQDLGQSISSERARPRRSPYSLKSNCCGLDKLAPFFRQSGATAHRFREEIGNMTPLIFLKKAYPFTRPGRHRSKTCIFCLRLARELLEQQTVHQCQAYRYLRPTELNLDQLLRATGDALGHKFITFLVRSGASPCSELPGSTNGTPMICTICDSMSTVESVQCLLDHGADVNQQATHGL